MKINWPAIGTALKTALAYTVAHPTFYDCLAAGGGQLAANLGWFKPWVTGLCFGWLLGRVLYLRRRLVRCLAPAVLSTPVPK